MPDELNTKHKVVGLKQSRRAIREGEAVKVFLAQDASGQIRREITALCRTKHVACESVPTMKELGELCGITVGAAVAAVVVDKTTDSDGI